MNILALFILIGIASTSFAISSSQFYSNPRFRHYYSYHPYQSYTDRNRRDLNSSASIGAEDLIITFRGDNVNIVNCSYQAENTTLTCVGPYSYFTCSSSLNYANLDQLSLDTHALGLVQTADNIVGPSFVKYRMYPFRKIVDNTTSTGITYDYLIPIYGSHIALSFVDTVSYSKKTVGYEQYTCLNQLIGLLNESKFFNRMKVISTIVNEEFKNLFDDLDDDDSDDDDEKKEKKLNLKPKVRSLKYN